MLPGGSEGSQMGHRWVVFHHDFWTRSLEVWEMLQMGNFDFHFSSLYMKLEAEKMCLFWWCKVLPGGSGVSQMDTSHL